VYIYEEFDKGMITLRKLIKSREMGMLYMLIVLCVIISVGNPVFLRIDNIMDLIRSNLVLCITAIGLLLPVLTGGIDVSISATIAFVTVVVGKFLINVSSNVFLAFLLGCLVGMCLGLINGVIIAKIKIPPIVATLGTMTITNGVMRLWMKGMLINNLPEEFISFGKFRFFEVQTSQGGITGIPVQVLILTGVVFVTWVVLKYTLIGRSIYAIGGNPVSAQRIGYNVDKTILFIYTYAGLLSGLAGVVSTSIMRQVDQKAFTGYELTVVAAVVLGGVNIAGGNGTLFGTILGVIFLSIINNGLILLHIPTFWQQIVIGVIIVIAASSDALRVRYEESKLKKIDID
jgi:ribose/xylose/arabinose/galactoside ABC-type transport system permease subunit